MKSDEEILVLAEKAFEKSSLAASCKDSFLEGYVEGFKQGYREARLAIAQRLLNHGFTCEEVASWVEIPLEEVEKL